MVVRTSVRRCTSDGSAGRLVLLIYVRLSTKQISTINSEADFDDHVSEEKRDGCKENEVECEEVDSDIDIFDRIYSMYIINNMHTFQPTHIFACVD